MFDDFDDVDDVTFSALDAVEAKIGCRLRDSVADLEPKDIQRR